MVDRCDSRRTSADKVVEAVRDAQREWTNNINWCGYADEADPPATYMGRTDKKAGQDGQNTIDWGSLENDESCAGALACAVTWYNLRGKPVESDMRFDTASKWAIGGITALRFDIQSVAAHEFGHVYQFDHVANSSQNDQTTVMWPYVFPEIRPRTSWGRETRRQTTSTTKREALQPRPSHARGAGCPVRCPSRITTVSETSWKTPPQAGLSCEPTPGLEPGTPSLRVKCSTS